MAHQYDLAERYRTHSVFTTGQVAEICGVSQQTVIRAFDAGRLVGFRVPGSKCRRIPRAALVAYMRANDLPMTLLEGSQQRVLVVESDPVAGRELMRAFTTDPRFDARSAATGFDAGMLTERCRPHLIILQNDIDDLDATRVCRHLRGMSAVYEPRIIVVSQGLEATEIERLHAAGMDAHLAMPVDRQAALDAAEILLFV